MVVDMTHALPPDERPPLSAPKDRSRACWNCGLEVIVYKGTNAFNGLFTMVGPRCGYVLLDDEKKEAVLNV